MPRFAEIAERMSDGAPADPSNRDTIPGGTWHRIDIGGPSSPSGSLPSMTEQRALALTAVYACLTGIGSDIATLSINEYRREADGSRTEDRGRAHRLLTMAPDDERDSFHWHQTTQMQCLGWGNAYSEIEFTNGFEPHALHLLSPDPNETGAARAPLSGRLFYEIDRRRKSVAPWQMLHLAGPSLDGITGIPVLRLFREACALGMDAQTFGRIFYEQGTLQRGVVEVPQTLSETAYTNLREYLDEVSGQGIRNAHRPMMLDGGATYKSTMIAPEEAQFLGTREFQAVEMCRIFRYPPHKAGISSNAPRANVEEANLEYVTETLMAWVRMRESAFNRRLYPPADAGRRWVEYNLASYLRGNMAARSAFYREMWSLGAITTNEIRRRENLDPIGEAGDQAIAPANMTTLDALLKAAQAPAPPATNARGVSWAGATPPPADPIHPHDAAIADLATEAS